MNLPLVGVGTFYHAVSGHSAWIFAWPLAEQVKLGVSMEAAAKYLMGFSLPDMLSFVQKGFHTILKAERVVWIPYGWNVAIISLNTELEDAGANSSSHIIAMPMFSDKMAKRDFTPEVVKLLVKTVSDLHKHGEKDKPMWQKFGPVYEQWLLNFAASDGHDDAEDGSGDEESATIPAESSAKSDK